MKKRLTYALLASILMTNSVLIEPSYAWNLKHVSIAPINTIHFNEMVTIAGSTNLDKLIIRVKRPNGSLMYFDIIDVHQGDFINSFRMPALEESGIYNIEVGNDSDISTTQFQYISKTEPPSQPDKPNKPEQPIIVNKTELLATMEEARLYAASMYTAGSWARLQMELTKCQQVYEDIKATQLEVDEATSQLKHAIKALQRLSPETSDEEEISSNTNQKLEEVSIFATDLRNSPDQNMTLQATEDFIKDFKELYENTAVETIEFIIEDEVDENLNSKIKLGLKVNNKQLMVKGKIPPVEVTLAYEADKEREAEYFAIKHIGENKSKRAVRTQYDSNSVSFIVEELGDYQISYHEEKFMDLQNVPMQQRSINSLVAQGIIKGRTHTHFMPEASVTRAEYIVLLMRTLNLETAHKELFKDVAPTHYYYHEANAAKALGIVNGKGDNYFKPNEKITKQEMFLMTQRALKIDGVLEDEEQAKLLEQLENLNVSRAETAVLLYEIYKSYEQLVNHAFTISIIPTRV